MDDVLRVIYICALRDKNLADFKVGGNKYDCYILKLDGCTGVPGDWVREFLEEYGV